jgi:hypothetical protein
LLGKPIHQPLLVCFRYKELPQYFASHDLLRSFLFCRVLLALQESSRREAIKSAAAVGAAFLPVAAANAAVGESPRFSVFGLIGDTSSYSEGTAYGTDQSTPLYSPYSVYGDVGADSLFTKNDYSGNKKAILVETKKRLAKLPGYVESKKWWEVRAELSRYMYETRGAVRGLATTPTQKKAATAFFKAIETADNGARLKKGDMAMQGSKDAAAKLDAFVATL